MSEPETKKSSKLLYRRPYWNLWSIVIYVFLGWHAAYAWVWEGMASKVFQLGDDATVALLTGGFGVIGYLVGMAAKFTQSGPVQGSALMPNLLFCMGAATVMLLEIVALAAFGISMGIELKGVVIGMILASLFGILQSMLAVGGNLIEESGTEE